MPQSPKMYAGHELGFVHSKVGKTGREVSRMSLTLITNPVVKGKGISQERHKFYLTDQERLDLANKLLDHH